MQLQSTRVPTVACLCAAALAAACSGGGSGGTDASAASVQDATTAGVYSGTLTSTSTGQTTRIVAMVDANGQTAWMSTDGRVWSGEMPRSGAHFDVSLTGHMHAGSTFPDGTTVGPWTMNVDHPNGGMSGLHSGAGDTGHFSLTRNPMWSRPASLQTLAGVYSRSTWSGYSMTMAIGTDGQIVATDTRGCSITGAATVPDATRNLYALSATVTSCGSLDGTYQGKGTLLDADAMRDWMGAMHPLEHGGHTHGNMGGMGGMGGMPYNTVPAGTSNLFMFVLRNDENAIMDALAR